MSITILPREETFGSQFGTALGSGIGDGIQEIARMKVDAMTRDRKKQQFKELLQSLGVPENKSDQMSSAIAEQPALFPAIVKQLSSERQSQQAQQTLQNIFGQQQQAQPYPTMQNDPEQPQGQTADQMQQQPMQQQGGGLPLNQQDMAYLSQAASLGPRELMKAVQDVRSSQESQTLQRQKMDSSLENAIRKENAPYKKEVRQRYTANRKILSIVDKLQKNINKHLTTGSYTRLPTEFQNKQTQLIESLTNELVAAQAQGLSTRPSQELLKILRTAKPNLLMKSKAFKQRLNEIKEDAQDGIQEQKIVSELSKKNNGRPIENLQEQVADILEKNQEQKSQQPTQQQARQRFDSLPAASNFPAGQKIRDTNTGRILQSDGTKWISVG